MTLFATSVVTVFFLLASSIVFSSVREQRASVREAERNREIEIEQQTKARVLAERIQERKDTIFSGAEAKLTGVGAIVYDINAGDVLFEKNADTPLPLASITKVMTVITAQDILPKGATITIDQRALDTEGESGLVLGEIWNFKELADLMLIVSSNDASTAIADAAGRVLAQSEGKVLTEEEGYALFIQKMNEKAKKIGMEHAYFENSSGLDLNNETKASAVATPRDIAKLFSYALLNYPDIMNHSRFGSYSVVSLNGRNFQAENTNDLADTIPGLLASKTGYTLQAGGNLALVIDVGFMRPVVIVVLGSTREERFRDVQELYTITKKYYQAL